MIKKRAAVYPVHVDSGTGDVWPRVNHWLTHFDRPHLAEAAWATCQEQVIAPYSDLPALRRQQQVAPGALASIVAFDPAEWRLVRLDVWREPRWQGRKTANCSASAICPPPLTTLRRGLTVKLDIDNHYQH